MNVNWIRYFFQFIKHVLNETSSTHRALFPVSFSFQFFILLLFVLHSPNAFYNASIFVFCFQHFGSFCLFLIFYSTPFSFWTEGRKRLKNAYNFMLLLSVRMCFFLSHSWLIFRLESFLFFSFFGFSFFMLLIEGFSNTKNWNKHVQSIHDKLDEKRNPLFAFICWMTKQNCVVCFDNRPKYFLLSNNGEWCIYERSTYEQYSASIWKPNQFGEIKMYNCMWSQFMFGVGIWCRNAEITKREKKNKNHPSWWGSTKLR